MSLARFAAVALAGCAYRGGSFVDADYVRDFPGERVRLGCIDLAVAASPDPRARGPVIEYAFGNRCEGEVTVDLASIRAVGHDARGAPVALAAFDPAREIRPLPLGARWSSNEHIEYAAATEGIQLASVCVDIGGVDGSAPRTEQWICVPEEPR